MHAAAAMGIDKKARLEQQKNQLNADMVKLFCVVGIPPSKVDLPQQKVMWHHAVPSYEPASASRLQVKECQIPTEAAFVRTQQLQHLRLCDYLSMTFDRQTTRLPESVYTVHIVTPVQCVFLFEGNNESHTAEYIFKILDEVNIHWYYVQKNISHSHESRFSGIFCILYEFEVRLIRDLKIELGLCGDFSCFLTL
jgi:hypothetical protein